MPETQGTGYLSIGEVLGLLLEEFPDVTISKIRFLESQGLISPERTASGYRKFYDDDVQLLRVILAEQRQNYLPLRVIKDRLKTGEIDPTGEHLRPDDDDGEPAPTAADGDAPPTDDHVPPADVPSTSIASHPASRSQTGDATAATERPDAPDASDTEATPDGGDTAPAQMLPGVLLDRAELCAMVGMTDGELEQLENFGIVTPRDTTGSPLYGDEAVEIAKPACSFLRAGVDARHLRNWRTSAEREASLYEQLVTPRFRQRNPESRAEALTQLRELDQLGARLRAALTRHALRHHFDV